MKVVEVDSVFNDVIGATDITCAPLSSTLVFNDRRAGAYTVEASVTQATVHIRFGRPICGPRGCTN